MLTEESSGLGPFADPANFTGPLDVEDEDPAALVDQLRTMMTIRRVEELIGGLVETGEARCPCHLGIGQEAVATGVAASLNGKDKILGAHRSHSHYLALGGDPASLFAEVLGKAKGCSGGMGGSMHLCDPPNGLMGTVPIVAATIPIAAGAALAAKMDGDSAVAVSFFGDGASEEGVFHETLNLAAVWELPLIFVCENNFFSSHLHISLRQPSDSISRFALANRIPFTVVDGNDIVMVAGAAEKFVSEAREGSGPAFLEAVTYRWRGHVGHREDLDVGVRRAVDLALWKRCDPIDRLARGLIQTSALTGDQLSQMWSEVDQMLLTALEEARSAPYPDQSSLLGSVYSAS